MEWTSTTINNGRAREVPASGKNTVQPVSRPRRRNIMPAPSIDGAVNSFTPSEARERFVRGETTDAPQQRCEVLTVNVLHGEKVQALGLADVVDSADVGV
jgi:hypothetical protein